MLTINGVTKEYDGLKANDNISFSVDDGEISILLGPNGAGKSTIIKCIAGLLRYEGDIAIDKLSNRDIEAKRRLGYVPELPAVYDNLTVAEHIEFVRRAWRVSDDSRRSEDLLERLELADKKKKLGRELSKGMQQKLSICCALSHKPSSIVFDEPLVGLDPHAIKELKLIFRELRDEGCAVLISTHMIDSVEDYWDTAHIMVKGSFAATMRNDGENGGAQSLEDLFFEITEKGGGEEQEQ